MKKLLISLVFLIALLVILGSCTTNKMEHISKDYEIYGTWVNPEYDDYRSIASVRIMYPNNLAEWYDTVEKKNLKDRLWYDITNKWMDREGNAWYTIIYINLDKTWSYELVKLSSSGEVLESMWNAYEYPKRMIPGSQGHEGEGDYTIRYRE